MVVITFRAVQFLDINFGNCILVTLEEACSYEKEGLK